MKIAIGLLAAALLLAAGCGQTVKVDGKSYEVITEEEENFLIRLSRLSLERSPKAVSREELAVARKERPEISVEYTGDKFGRALVTWQLPERKLSVVFEGDLIGSNRIVYLQSERNPVEFIDYSKGKPVVRKRGALETGSEAKTETQRVKSPVR